MKEEYDKEIKNMQPTPKRLDGKEALQKQLDKSSQTTWYYNNKNNDFNPAFIVSDDDPGISSSFNIVGTCSLCGGPVKVPEMWMGIDPPIPQCSSCGASKKNKYGNVIEMERSLGSYIPIKNGGWGLPQIEETIRKIDKDTKKYQELVDKHPKQFPPYTFTKDCGESKDYNNEL